MTTKRITLTYIAIIFLTVSLLAIPTRPVLAVDYIYYVVSLTENWSVSTRAGIDYTASAACTQGTNPTIMGIAQRGSVTGGNTRGYYIGYPTPVTQIEPITSGVLYTIWDRNDAAWTAAGSPSEFDTNSSGTRAQSNWPSGGVSRVQAGYYSSTVGATFSLVYSKVICRAESTATNTPTAGPTATNTTAPTATNTVGPTATIQSTQTTNNKVCRAGHTLKANYVVFNYTTQAAPNGWGGYVQVRLDGQGETNYAELRSDWIYTVNNAMLAGCFANSNIGGEDPCGKLRAATGYPSMSSGMAPFSPDQISSFTLTSYYLSSATITVFEYGYLCYGDGEYYVVRNSGGVTHDFGASIPNPLTWTGDIVETECRPSSINMDHDLVALGTVTAGSLSAVQTSNDPAPYGTITIDVTLSYNLPNPVWGSPGGTQASLHEHISSAQSVQPIAEIGQTTINGSVYYNDQIGAISLMPGTTAITVHYTQSYSGDLAPALLDSLILTVNVENPLNDGILNCDGGQELDPGVTPWDKLYPELQFGRLLSNLGDFYDPLDGAPACGSGFQVIGFHPPIMKWLNLGYEASTAYEYFTSPGGTVYYKFRYRSAGILGSTPNSPHIYLTEKESGAVVMDLIGSQGYYDPALVERDWTLVTGEITLGAGNFGVYLDAAYTDSAVYYDDVYFSTRPWEDDSCTNEFVLDIKITPGPSPTPSITPSASPTGTIQVTAITSTITSTATLMRTATKWPTTTPRNTYTPGPSATRRATVTLTITPNGWQPSPLPNITITATYGQVLPSITPNATNPGQGTPNPDMPGDNQGDGPIGFSGDGAVDCRRPTNWFSIAWWIDYERCLALSFITFGPSQRATAAAVPGIFARYEPFGTIKEFSDGVVSVRTEVASYPWNGTGAADGVNDAIKPSQPLKSGGTCSDPWNGNLNLGGDCENVVAEWNDGCSAKIASYMPGALARGTCFVFGVTKNIGLLPWMQFMINIVALLMPIRMAFTIIEMRNQVAGVVSTVSSYQDRSNA